MALRISRRSMDCGRPPGLGLGIRGWTSFHWASVRSVGYFARLIPFSTPKTRGEVHFSHRLLGAFDRIDNQDIAEERRVHFVGRIGKNRYSPHFDKVKHSRLTILRIMLTVTDFGGRLVFDFRQLIARNARRPFVPTT